MDEKELRTSPKQRVFIILIAIFMVGSIVASYAVIVISGSQAANDSTENKIDPAKVAQYKEEYDEKSAELKEISKSDYERFMKYKNEEVKSYNEVSANDPGVETKDLEKGTGEKVKDDNYLAYYVGWCADESVFDSSFDDNEKPTGFAKVLDPSAGMIEGWTAGVEGMRIGGIREITVPGELAYGDQMEICGGKNKPLKFLILAVDNKDPLKTLASEIDDAYMRYQYAQYGIDYDDVSQGTE